MAVWTFSTTTTDVPNKTVMNLSNGRYDSVRTVVAKWGRDICVGLIKQGEVKWACLFKNYDPFVGQDWYICEAIHIRMILFRRF